MQLPEVSGYGLAQCYATLYVEHFANTNPELLRGAATERQLFTQCEDMVVKVGVVTTNGYRRTAVWDHWRHGD